MHHGKVAAIGTPPKVEASLCRFTVTLDDVFVYYEKTRGKQQRASVKRQNLPHLRAAHAR